MWQKLQLSMRLVPPFPVPLPAFVNVKVSPILIQGNNRNCLSSQEGTATGLQPTGVRKLHQLLCFTHLVVHICSDKIKRFGRHLGLSRVAQALRLFPPTAP